MQNREKNLEKIDCITFSYNRSAPETTVRTGWKETKQDVDILRIIPTAFYIPVAGKQRGLSSFSHAWERLLLQATCILLFAICPVLEIELMDGDKNIIAIIIVYKYTIQ